MIIDGKEVDMYTTSTHSDSIQCPKCGDEGRRYVWVNTIVRAMQIKEHCWTCDYERFEPWEVVEEQRRCACKGCNACDPKHQCARNSEYDVCAACAMEMIRTLDDKPPAYDFEDEAAAPAKKGTRLGSDWTPVTLDEWHRALGVYNCFGCGVSLFNGDKHVWQGRKRWCEKCFWGDDSQSALSDVPTDFDGPEKENTNVDQRGN